HAGERAADHRRQRLGGQRLGHARRPLQQHVPAGQQRDQQPLDQALLADDHLADLEQRLLEQRSVVRRGGGGGHGRNVRPRPRGPDRGCPPGGRGDDGGPVGCPVAMEVILIAVLLVLLVVGGVAYVRRSGRDKDLEPPPPSTGLERRGTTPV